MLTAVTAVYYRVYTRIRVAGHKLYDPCTCRHQHVSCIGDKIVASLSPHCCWIQRDTSDTHFNSNYVAEIQSTSIQDEQLVSGDIRCPGVHAALGTAVWRSMEPLKSLSAAQTPTAREGLQSSQGGDLSCNRKVEG